MDVDEFREKMHITRKWIYLNHAAIGPLPTDTFIELSEITMEKTLHGAANVDLMAVNEEYAKMQAIGTKILGTNREDTIFFPQYTQLGMLPILDGVDFAEGGNIVITDMEFTQNSFPFQVYARKTNRELRIAKNVDGQIPWESFEKVIDDETRIVALSHVQFSNGFKTDLRSIAALCHDHGAFLLVDAIQSLGTMEFKARDWDVDGVVAGGYKWLLGPFNTGIGYVAPHFLEKIDPTMAGWMTDQDFLNMTHHPYNPVRGAKRLQGHINSTLFALYPSLKLLTSVGLRNIEARVKNLTNHIIKRAEEMELKVASPREAHERGAIVKIDLKNAKRGVAFLKAHNVSASFRDGGIRFAPHAYNTVEEIDKAMDLIGEFLKTAT